VARVICLPWYGRLSFVRCCWLWQLLRYILFTVREENTTGHRYGGKAIQVINIITIHIYSVVQLLYTDVFSVMNSWNMW